MPTYIPNKAAGTDIPVERLSGSVERVTFHSEETGFCVLRVKVKGHHDHYPNSQERFSDSVRVNCTAVQIPKTVQTRMVKIE